MLEAYASTYRLVSWEDARSLFVNLVLFLSLLLGQFPAPTLYRLVSLEDTRSAFARPFFPAAGVLCQHLLAGQLHGS
jgi:hypothetical protein